MTEEVRIFVSHSHVDAAFTQRLVTDLQAAGADVWVDTDQISSDDFIRKINEGFVGRQWLVLVMTPDSLHSQWVQAEVNAALNQVRKGRMRAVIPVVAESCSEADIPVLWDSLFRFDATGSYPYALSGLCKSLGLSVPTDTSNVSREHLRVSVLSQRSALPRPSDAGDQDSAASAIQTGVRTCRCGCGNPIKSHQVFVDKEHQLIWMENGGAREMNALMSKEAKSKGGKVAGRQALRSGRLLEAGRKGAARSRQIAASFRASRSADRR